MNRPANTVRELQECEVLMPIAVLSAKAQEPRQVACRYWDRFQVHSRRLSSWFPPLYTYRRVP